MLELRGAKGRVLYNSRGERTVEVEVDVSGYKGRAMAPAGKSRGKREVRPFPEDDPFLAVKRLNEYEDRLKGVDPKDPYALRDRLRDVDGTENYSYVGGSVAFALSFSLVDACSKAIGRPRFELISKGPYSIPYPLGNTISGGKHGGKGAPEIQEFLILPIGAKDIRDALEANFMTHGEAGKLLEARDECFSYGRSDEGAWMAKVSNETAFDILMEACDRVKESLGIKMAIGADVAASSFWNGKRYIYRGRKLDREEQVGYVLELIDRFGLFYVEDPVEEDDLEGLVEITSQVKGIYITGDDLFVTRADRLRLAAEKGAGNSGILKVNQAGTLADALDYARVARESGYGIVVSHRSGDTPEEHIADLAVALGSEMIKTGIMNGERIAKLNELVRMFEIVPEMAKVVR